MELSKSIVLVTGANKGIGAAIVRELLARGVSKVYAGMRTPIVFSDPRVEPLALDVTVDAQIANAVRVASDVNVVVNNAGVSLHGGPIAASRDSKIAEEEMRVNYFGTLAMARAFAPVIAKNSQNHGTDERAGAYGSAIVNVLSILSRVPVPVLGSYSASKAAAYSLTQSLRGELAKNGTLVVAAMPGFVDTDMTKGVTQPKATTEEVAKSIVDALRDNVEDVYPGAMATEIASALAVNAKAVEKQLASFSPRG